MVEQIDQKAAIELIDDQQRLIAELNEKLMFCSQAAEARMIAHMREPDAKMVEAIRRAVHYTISNRDAYAAFAAAADEMENDNAG